MPTPEELKEIEKEIENKNGIFEVNLEDVERFESVLKKLRNEDLKWFEEFEEEYKDYFKVLKFSFLTIMVYKIIKERFEREGKNVPILKISGVQEVDEIGLILKARKEIVCGSVWKVIFFEVKNAVKILKVINKILSKIKKVISSDE